MLDFVGLYQYLRLYLTQVRGEFAAPETFLNDYKRKNVSANVVDAVFSPAFWSYFNPTV